jgi:hypothetical protein
MSCLPSLGRETREKGLLWNSHLLNDEYYVRLFSNQRNKKKYYSDTCGDKIEISMLLPHFYTHCTEYQV